MKTLLTLAAVLAAGAVHATADDGFTLKRVPKEGQVLTYRTESQMYLKPPTPGTPAPTGTSAVPPDAVLTSTSVFQVVKVDPNGGYTVQMSGKNAKLKFQDQEFEPPSQTSITVYGPTGDITEIRNASTTPASYRMNNLTTFFPPDHAVKVGDAWSRDLKEDSKTGAVTVHVDFKVAGEETLGTHDTAKVEATAKELEGADPASVTSTYWIDKTDGTLVKVTASWTNVRPPGTSTPINGTFTMTRIDPPTATG